MNKTAIAKKSQAGVIKQGDEYPYVRMEGNNIVIEVDGFEIGFSSEYLKLVDTESERRKTLVDERISIERQVSLLNKRLSEINTQITDIDNGLANQLSIE